MGVGGGIGHRQDQAVDALLKMPSMQSLTLKENGMVTADGLKKLAAKKWTTLDVGSAEAAAAQ